MSFGAPAEALNNTRASWADTRARRSAALRSSLSFVSSVVVIEVPKDSGAPRSVAVSVVKCMNSSNKLVDDGSPFVIT